MQRYLEALLDSDNGSALPGYFAQLTDLATLAVVPIYADLNGTPIEQVSGVADMAQSDAAGNLSFFYPDGFYNLNVYAPDGTTLYGRFLAIGSDVQNTKGLYTPALTGGTVAGVATGTIAGFAALNGAMAEVVISATWTAHTGSGHATISLPTSIGAFGVTTDPSLPTAIPGAIAYEGFVLGSGRILTAVVNPAYNRIRLWEQSVGDGVSAITRTPFLLPSAGTLYLSARYPVTRT